MTSLSEKTCTRCGETKAIRHFWRRSASKDGFSAACVTCRQAEWRERAGRPEERVRKRKVDAEWRENNRQRTKAYYRVYRAIEFGKIKRPDACPKCKAKKPVVASFIRIEKPIEFVWLCRQCISDGFWRRT